MTRVNSGAHVITKSEATSAKKAESPDKGRKSIMRKMIMAIFLHMMEASVVHPEPCLEINIILMNQYVFCLKDTLARKCNIGLSSAPS